MSKSAATRPRPLSPHLFIYKPIPTMVMSIVHRITGASLYFGILLVAAWLLAAATSEAWFNTVSAIYGSWLGLLVLFGFTWSLVHHMLGGVRHFVMDLGLGLDKHFSTKVAALMPVVSIALTVLLWVVGFMARGA
ncbi:succinate dehydrogenase, cytochrome b556 subunit [Mesorhizobium microcysteis]|uniref:Succinate dehydrogenase cytochrome b556 subunit n=1 Tax=Neoaquamicrobium microcysteis TaxID=2682781 RepID=A0A5D4GSS7_9HYPH|nr:succinate dehydrogenase, cytochrome b556 subunit [Mesorhizobium microcysteis]TYR31418.1 succinate dehydrogenase, cytochrome b556 subunit [Mesorhizobium microcysteis]